MTLVKVQVQMNMGNADKDNVGLYMIQIIKDSDKDRQFDWGVVYKCAGIYRPASADKK